MPFDGQPSRGCKECRERKVKCDQSSPFCQRCCRAGRHCSGYRPRTELVFRHMTSETEIKVTQRVQTHASGPLNTISSSISQTLARKAREEILHELQAIYRPSSYNLPLTSPGWQELAVMCFFDDYIIFSDIINESLHFVPDLYKSSNLCDLLKEALHAASFASKGNQLGLVWMITEGDLAYNRALLLFVEVSENRAMDDSTLAATYLLGLYESISGKDCPGSLFSLHHHQGRSLLLRLRGDNQFHNPTQRSLFRTSYGLIIMKCIATHKNPPEEAERWLELLGKDDLSLQLAKANLCVARLCATAQLLFDSTARSELWILGVLQVMRDAIAIDVRYQDWDESARALWPYYTVRTSLKPYPSVLDSASSKLPQTTPGHTTIYGSHTSGTIIVVAEFTSMKFYCIAMSFFSHTQAYRDGQ